MALPFFYIEQTDASGIIQLNEETSKHIVQVLRMKVDEQLQLTDGKGNIFTCAIIDDHRKKCVVKILSQEQKNPSSKKNTIAISLVKNNTRFEWLLEKATELGISAIVPLICTRTEKQHFRSDRMRSILISAMLQSQQAWLPELPEPVKFSVFIKNDPSQKKLIAHCEDGSEKILLTKKLSDDDVSRSILIGPEGDFTSEEIALALENNYAAVSLGETRLRTETAGLTAAVLMAVDNSGS